MKPMANFPPSDGSIRSHESRDEDARQGSGVEQTDLELVRRAQRGERGAFDLLVLRYQHRVVKLVARLLRDPTEAEDVAQDAFVKAYRALGSFRGDSAFYTWLYRIAINTAKNHLVSRARRPRGVDIDAEDAEHFASASALRDLAGPENILMTEQLRAVIERAIAALPEDLRTALSLREFDGLSYEEIADAMQCPVGTVRSRIFRAREAIDHEILPLITGN